MLTFWLKLLQAKLNSDELSCPVTALIIIGFPPAWSVFLLLCYYPVVKQIRVRNYQIIILLLLVHVHKWNFTLVMLNKLRCHAHF